MAGKKLSIQNNSTCKTTVQLLLFYKYCYFEVINKIGIIKQKLS